MADYSELIPLSTRKPFIQLIVSMMIIVLISLAGIIIALLSAWLFFGIAPGEADMAQSGLSPRQINYFKYIQGLQHLSMFLAPSLVIAFFMKGDFYSYLDLKNKPCLVAAVLSVLFIVFLLPLNSYLAWLNAGIDLPGWLDGFERWIDKKEMQAERITGILMSAGNVGGLLINLLVIAVIPAVGEEFLYRGVLQNIFARWLRSGIFAVILTALIFSATHLQFYGFVPRFILGLGFGYIYLWSRNIWLPVLAHLTNNAIPVVLSYFMTWENINSTMDEFSSSDGILAIIPAVIAVLIIIIIRKLSLKGD